MVLWIFFVKMFRATDGGGQGCNIFLHGEVFLSFLFFESLLTFVCFTPPGINFLQYIPSSFCLKFLFSNKVL